MSQDLSSKLEFPGPFDSSLWPPSMEGVAAAPPPRAASPVAVARATPRSPPTTGLSPLAAQGGPSPGSNKRKRSAKENAGVTFLESDDLSALIQKTKLGTAADPEGFYPRNPTLRGLCQSLSLRLPPTKPKAKEILEAFMQNR